MPRAKAHYFVLAVEPEVKGRATIYPDVRVSRSLKRKSKAEGIRCKTVIPRHRELVAGPDGKSRERQERSWPGYVVVKGVYSEDFFHLCDSVRGAAGLLPLDQVKDGSWKPTALDDEEAALLLVRQKCGGRAGDKPDYKVGDSVVVRGGSFAGRGGVVTALGGGPDGKAVVGMEVLGQTVSVTLPWWIVSKE